MRTFTVDGQVYNGFDLKTETAELLAIVYMYGEVSNIFGLNSPVGVVSIARMYEEVHGQQPSKIDIYRKEESLEIISV